VHLCDPLRCAASVCIKSQVTLHFGEGNHLVDMDEVYVRTKAAHKDQPVICLWHMKERFGGIAV
jgi:hypothetical protein